MSKLARPLLGAALCAAAAACTDVVTPPMAPERGGGAAAAIGGPQLRLAPRNARASLEQAAAAAGALARGRVSADGDADATSLVLAIGSTAVLWQRTGTGDYGFRSMSGTTPVPDGSGGWTPFTVSPGWRVEAVADFDRDGHTDLLFHQTGTANFGIWRMNALSLLPAGTGWTTLETSPGWEVADAADFDNDGYADLLFRNPSTGEQGIWKMLGLVPRTDANAWSGLNGSPGWRVEAAADFDANGSPDVVWHQTGTGNFGIWKMNGPLQTGPGTGWVSLTTGAGWNAVDATDFDNDGRPDILYYNPTSGDVAIQLFLGTVTNAWIPVSGMPGWVPVAASRFGVANPRRFARLADEGRGSAFQCAIDVAGAVWCWGSNSAGQLGDGTGVDRSLPVAVQGIGGTAVDVARGEAFACALTSAGRVYCWGLNELGQLGTTTGTASRSTAAQVPMPVGVTAFGALAAGARHACALASAGDSTGVAYCWGGNYGGKLGVPGPGFNCCNGADSPNPVPIAVPVAGRTDGYADVVAGSAYTCGLARGGSRTGTLFCWGIFPGASYPYPSDQWFTSRFVSPELAAGQAWLPRTIPLPAGVGALHGVVSGGAGLCAFAGPGPGAADVYCWGDVGAWLGTTFTTPTRLPPPDGVSPFAAVSLPAPNSSAACAVPAAGTFAGRVFCAGTQVPMPPGAAAVVQLSGSSAYGSFTGPPEYTYIAGNAMCALDANGVIYCWGGNTAGQLGRGTFGGFTTAPAPIVVP